MYALLTCDSASAEVKLSAKAKMTTSGRGTRDKLASPLRKVGPVSFTAGRAPVKPIARLANWWQ